MKTRAITPWLAEFERVVSAPTNQESALSESESFIHEVSDEVRRDKLFAFFRKWMWLFVLIVVGIVGGTAYNEYSKSQKAAEMQAAGEALLTAQDEATAAAFAPLTEGGASAALLGKFNLAAALAGEGQGPAAASILDEIALNSTTPPLYQDLALLKLVLIDGANMDQTDLLDIIDRLSQANSPFRLLAIEQRAIAHLRAGDRDATLIDLALILAAPDATQGLRNRAQELTIALGGDLATPSGAETSDG